MKKKLNLLKCLALAVLIIPVFLGFTVSDSKKAATELPTGAGTIDSDCTYSGFKLYGKMQVVDAFPDIKVQVVDAFPDLKVKVVTAFPDDCGEWEMVDAFPDVKIQFVDAFPDVKIQYVDAFPGL